MRGNVRRRQAKADPLTRRYRAVQCLLALSVPAAVGISGRSATNQAVSGPLSRTVVPANAIVDRHGDQLMLPVADNNGKLHATFPFGSAQSLVLLNGGLIREARIFTPGRATWGEAIHGPRELRRCGSVPLRTTLSGRYGREIERALLPEGVPGAVIVLRVHDSDAEVLALVDSALIDPERWYSDPAYLRELLKLKRTLYALTLSIQPIGSAVKPILGAMLLQSGMPEGFEVFCNGGTRTTGRWIRCTGSHGGVRIREALTKSCNSFFIEACDQFLFSNQIAVARTLHRLGVLDPQITGISVPPARLTLPDADAEAFASTAIGQRCQIPLIGLASGYASLVAGYSAHVHILTEDVPSGKAETVWAKQSLDIVHDGMRGAAMQGGTASSVRLFRGAEQAIAKTGTAETEQAGVSHALCAAIAPETGSDHSIVALVFLQGGGRGSRAAALAGQVIGLWNTSYSAGDAR